MINTAVKYHHITMTEQMAADLEALIPGYFTKYPKYIRPGEPRSYDPRKWAVWDEAHTINQLGAYPGVGGTYCYPNDRYPFTVTRIISPFCIIVRDDIAERTDSNGYGGQQEYRFFPNPLGRLHVLYYNKARERWQRAGAQGMPFFYIGKRSRYYAPEI